jgi:exonuclease SbcD
VGVIRILFLADTHLGFDHPFNPRVARRRRGPDFFRNYERALQPAYRGEVDLIVHGGDIFYRSRIPARLVEMAFEPLKRIADNGVAVYVVPGNHERSNIPYYILAAHPDIFVFDEPKTYLRNVNGAIVSLAGFPFLRHDVRRKFRHILGQTGWQKTKADVSILCMHQSVDGATMGPVNFTFRGGFDVVDVQDIPSGFALVLTGHMHRHQVLQSDLSGADIPTPVLYAGSIERTSFAEKDETKGYMTIDAECGKKPEWRFHPLPTRPMISFEIDGTGLSGSFFEQWLREKIKMLPADSIVKVKIHGLLKGDMLRAVRTGSLGLVVPQTMNIRVVLVDYCRPGR